MSSALDHAPWRRLPVELADLIEPELDRLADAVLGAIGEQVPEYARPLEGVFGEGLRTGVGEALRRFVELIRDPAREREHGASIYIALGAGEMSRGRSLDALQAAYRVGARISWRHLAALGRRQGIEAETMYLLAEAIFAYIDELAAESVEGYAREQSIQEGDRELARRELIASMTSGEPAAEDLAAAARKAGWSTPRTVAALATAGEDLTAVLSRLPPGCLGAQIGELGAIAVADPDGPGRRRALQSALEGRGGALGCTVAPVEFRLSWIDASAALVALEPGELIETERSLLSLIAAENRVRLERIRARRLAPLEALTANASARHLETLTSYLRRMGNVGAMAADLHLHPQTVRYRLGRLRELLGDQLDDPTSRLELAMALAES